MAQYEIKFNRYDGWSYEEGECAEERMFVELSDEEVQILIDLMKQYQTFDTETLNLQERHPALYNKLNDVCESLAQDVALAEALKEAHFDSDEEYYDFVPMLKKYCTNNCGYTRSLGNFNNWLYKHLQPMNCHGVRNLYERASVDIWEVISDIEADDYNVIIPQSIVSQVFNK